MEIISIKVSYTHPVYAKLITLKSYCNLRQDYRKHREIPLLVALIKGTNEYSGQLHTSEIHACYEIKLEYQLSQHKMYNINENKQVPNTQIIVNKISNKFENYTHVYTNGSFDSTTGKSDIGVHPGKNYSFSNRQPNFTQICTAEIIAINKAVCTN